MSDWLKQNWPRIKTILILVPKFLFGTKTGRTLVIMLLVQLGVKVDEKILESILEAINSGLFSDALLSSSSTTWLATAIPWTLSNVVTPLAGVYGTIYANETKKDIQALFHERLSAVLPDSKG